MLLFTPKINQGYIVYLLGKVAIQKKKLKRKSERFMIHRWRYYPTRIKVEFYYLEKRRVSLLGYYCLIFDSIRTILHYSYCNTKR